MTQDSPGLDLSGKIGFGVIAVIIVQLMGVAWLISDMSTRIGILEEKVSATENTSERIVALETTIELKFDNLEKALDRLSDSRD